LYLCFFKKDLVVAENYEKKRKPSKKKPSSAESGGEEKLRPGYCWERSCADGMTYQVPIKLTRG